MKRKRLIPKAWMELRDCCGGPPLVTYDPGYDVTVIHCDTCGLMAVNCYDDEVIEHWNGGANLERPARRRHPRSLITSRDSSSATLVVVPKSTRDGRTGVDNG
jgi:hypothetical protein